MSSKWQYRLFLKEKGFTSFIEHRIETGDKRPLAIGLRNLVPIEGDIIRLQVKKMLDEDTVKPSESPWSFAVVVIKKKDGLLQFCVDYRQLNSITKKTLIRSVY